MSLTDKQVMNLRPREERYEVSDGDGLFVLVGYSGKKSWVFRYRFGSDQKPRRMTLGNYPMMTLSKAREKHGQAMQDLEKGIDPGATAKDGKTQRKAEPTFKDLLDEFWKKELSKSPTAKERKRLVEKDALPFWSSRKVSSIKRRDAVVLLDDVRERAPVTANRLQGVLVRMFNFASERGIIDFSPLVGMRRGEEQSRARVLTNEEIKNLWNCLDLERTDIDIYRLTKLALKAILLTGQRPGEVAGMRWDELADETWIIPEDRTKNQAENRIPILPMMADIIEQAKAYSADSVFVFRSSHDKERPLTVGAMANAIRRHRGEMKIEERFTPHDLRRTLRTRLAEAGVSDMIAEKVLNHKLQGVLGIYNRHGYDAEKRHALSLWEQRLKEIIGLSEPTSNVIPFAPGVQNG